MLSLFKVLLSVSLWSSLPVFPSPDVGDFVFEEIVESSYSPCIDECPLVNCISIELIDDMNVEGTQEFGMEIISVSLASIGTPRTTTISIKDTIGG